MRSSLLLLLAAIPAAAGESPPRRELLERVLAAVDERPLLLSEVRLEQEVKHLDREDALEAAIDAQLMYQEAARLPQTAVSSEDEERLLAGLLDKRPELRGLAEEAELRRMVRREAVTFKYIDFRFRPQVRVSDEALREAYAEEYGAKGDALAFEAVESELRRRLEKRDLGLRIETWVRELRARADIRYVPAEDGAAGPGRP